MKDHTNKIVKLFKETFNKDFKFKTDLIKFNKGKLVILIIIMPI